jgi:hypothetical protein
MDKRTEQLLLALLGALLLDLVQRRRRESLLQVLRVHDARHLVELGQLAQLLHCERRLGTAATPH